MGPPGQPPVRGAAAAALLQAGRGEPPAPGDVFRGAGKDPDLHAGVPDRPAPRQRRPGGDRGARRAGDVDRVPGWEPASRGPPRAGGDRPDPRTQEGVPAPGPALLDPGIPSERRDRGRGPAVPLPHRGRRHRDRPGDGRQPEAATVRPGRLDDHPAAREELLPGPEEDDRPEAARGGAGRRARSAVHEGPDPRDVPEQDLLRAGRLPRDLRHRGGGGLLLLEAGGRADPSGIGAPGGHHPLAEPVLPLPGAPGGEGAAQRGPREDAPAGHDPGRRAPPGVGPPARPPAARPHPGWRRTSRTISSRSPRTTWGTRSSTARGTPSTRRSIPCSRPRRRRPSPGGWKRSTGPPAGTARRSRRRWWPWTRRTGR